MPLPAGTIGINYLETESVTALGGQIQAAVAKNMPLITPSFASRGSGLAGRITFLGATNASNFANTPLHALQTNTIPSGYPVPFGAADTGANIANRIVLLIDGLESGRVAGRGVHSRQRGRPDQWHGEGCFAAHGSWHRPRRQHHRHSLPQRRHVLREQHGRAL